MDLKPFIWTLTKDPYWVGPVPFYVTNFFWKRTFVAQTSCGFKIKYTVRCFIRKYDHEQFRAARMLEEKNQQELIDAWHYKSFLTKLKELG